MSYVKIDVKPFVFGGSQEFDIWLKRYIRAVDAALAATATAEQKTAAYLRYIGTKLDDFSHRIYEASEHTADWVELKKELLTKLSDPAKAQAFRDNVDSIKWDQEMPLHSYENIIITSTRDLDPDVAANDNVFKRDTFKRFLAGLPQDYQNYIDMSMPMRTYDIKQARERAEKFQELLRKNEGRNPLATWGPAGLPAPTPMLAFGAYKPNAMDTLNDQMSLLHLAQKEAIELHKESNKSINSLVEQLSRPSRDRSRESFKPRNRTPSGERGRPYNQQYNSQPHNQQYNSQPHNQQQHSGQPFYNQQYNSQPHYNQQYNNGQYFSQPYNNQPNGNQHYNNGPPVITNYNSGPPHNGQQYNNGNGQQYNDRPKYDEPKLYYNRQSQGNQGNQGWQGGRSPQRTGRSPNRQQLPPQNQQSPSSQQGPQIKFRHDQSGERSRGAAQSPQNERGDERSASEQTHEKKVDFHMPADAPQGQDPSQPAPHSSQQRREDF